MVDMLNKIKSYMFKILKFVFELSKNIIFGICVFYFFLGMAGEIYRQTNNISKKDFETSRIIVTSDPRVICKKCEEEDDENTWFVFDASGVLVRYADDIVMRDDDSDAIDALEQELEQASGTDLNTLNAELAYIRLRDRPIEIMNQEFVDLLQKFASQKTRYMVLVQLANTGFGDIPSYPEHIFKALKTLNYPIGHSFPEMHKEVIKYAVPKFRYEDLAAQYPPIFLNDVLFGGFHTKSSMVKSFIKQFKKQHAKFVPNKIVFVTADWNALQLMCYAVQNSGLEFVGIYYTHLDLEPISHYNLEVVKLQRRILYKDKKYISYQEAKSILDRESKTKQINANTDQKTE